MSDMNNAFQKDWVEILTRLSLFANNYGISPPTLMLGRDWLQTIQSSYHQPIGYPLSFCGVTIRFGYFETTTHFRDY